MRTSTVIRFFSFHKYVYYPPHMELVSLKHAPREDTKHITQQAMDSH